MDNIEVKTTSIRMPIELVNWLSLSAKQNFRNFSGEVVKILEEKRMEVENSSHAKN